jgi:ATP-binding cassette, subfamily F, member 3
VILISHDRHLLETSVDRLWLVADGTVQPFDDDIDAYRRMVLKGDPAPQNGERPRAGAKPQMSRSDQRRAAAERRAELQPLRDRLKRNEREIERLNARIEALDRDLADPDLFARDPDKGAELARQRARAVEAVAQAEEDWLAAGAELEAAQAGAD